MDLIVTDLSFLLLATIIASTITLYYYYDYYSYFDFFCINTFAVVELIRVLKKACPVDFEHKWTLLSLNVGLPRCWTKEEELPGFPQSYTLYGTSCALSCSSMYACSLISDVTKWGEWDPIHGCKPKQICMKEMLQDSFMQADSVVDVLAGSNVSSNSEYYRFINFPENTVRWVLFWSVKKFEFMFFLIQPAVSKTVESQCLITHIFCTNSSSSQLACQVGQRLLNVRDFLLISQLNVIAAKCAPTLPPAAVSQVSSPFDSGTAPPPTNAPTAQRTVSRLFLEPEGTHGFRLDNGRFRLLLRKDEKLTPKKEKREKSPSQVTSVPSKDNFKRASSEMSIKRSNAKGLSSTRSKSFDSKSKPRIILEEESSKGHRRCASEPGVDVPKTSSGSELQTDDEGYINLHIIHEDVVEEASKNDLFCSSTSDFELIECNQQFLDCKIADFLTQGNYGASELQAEMLLASQFDRFLSPQEQTSGGWVYHSTHKGITLLTKTTAGQFLKIVSYLCQIDLPISAAAVWKCVKNPRFRFILDETVKTVKIVERISDSQRLIHVYHESSGFLRKECLDLCLLQTEREEANHFYSSFHSTEYEKCPLMTHVTRGSLRPSGWVVEKRGRDICRVTHLLQVIVNSPDSLYIQDLCTLVPLSVHNLKNYFLTKPKLLL